MRAAADAGAALGLGAVRLARPVGAGTARAADRAAPVARRRAARLAVDDRTAPFRRCGVLGAQRLDPHVVVAVRRLGDGGGEAVGDAARDLEAGLARADPDGADVALGDVAAAADQGYQPARVGVALAADRHPE